MYRFINRRSSKTGLPPGTVVHLGEKTSLKTRIYVIDYDEAQVNEREFDNIEDCFPFSKQKNPTWINITGLEDTTVIEKIGKHFNIHPLVLEDIVNTRQRPKMEDFDDYLFIVLKMLYYDEEEEEVRAEQVSLILGMNVVFTFQEAAGDVFRVIRERIRTGKGRIRKMGLDYLAYSLMDAVIDNYFIVLEKLGEDLEELEDELVTSPDGETLQAIHGFKSEMIFLRRSVWPLREVIMALQRGESGLIGEAIHIYLRDLYDHTLQVIDTVETFRDMISGMLDIYLSSISNKMNEIMKVLTMIATIFIPLTFISGLYGMNFRHMPELEWWWGYPAVLTLMAAVAGGMLVYFRRKKWL